MTTRHLRRLPNPIAWLTRQLPALCTHAAALITVATTATATAAAALTALRTTR